MAARPSPDPSKPARLSQGQPDPRAWVPGPSSPGRGAVLVLPLAWGSWDCGSLALLPEDKTSLLE